MNYGAVLLVDGSNSYATCKELGFQPDYVKLRQKLELMLDTNIVKAKYFTAISDDKDVEIPIKPMLDFLEYNGWSIVHKPTKTFFNEVTGKRNIKGNMDVEMVLEAIKARNYCHDIILFTGDGDFVALVRELQDTGATVTVVSSIQTNPAMCADILRRQADRFIDVNDLKDQVMRSRFQLRS